MCPGAKSHIIGCIGPSSGSSWEIALGHPYVCMYLTMALSWNFIVFLFLNGVLDFVVAPCLEENSAFCITT